MLCKEFLESAAGLRIQGRERFVENPYRAIGEQYARKRRAPLLPGRQLTAGNVGALIQAEPLQTILDPWVVAAPCRRKANCSSSRGVRSAFRALR